VKHELVLSRSKC